MESLGTELEGQGGREEYLGGGGGGGGGGGRGCEPRFLFFNIKTQTEGWIDINDRQIDRQTN